MILKKKDNYSVIGLTLQR